MHWYLEVLKKYAVFAGRARRKEYWMFLLINVIVGVILNSIDFAADLRVNGIGILNSIYSLAVLLPSLAVGVRRLHDTGRSGWWLLLALIPCLGTVVLLVFFIQDSEAEANRFGPNPKAARQ